MDGKKCHRKTPKNHSKPVKFLTVRLIFTIIRELIGATFFAALFGIILNWGINGVWFGVLVGYTIGGLIAIVYAKWYLRRLIESEDHP